MVRTEATATTTSTAITAAKASSVTAYETLIEAEKTAHTIEIREISTGKEGVANTCKHGVAVYYAVRTTVLMTQSSVRKNSTSVLKLQQ